MTNSCIKTMSQIPLLNVQLSAAHPFYNFRITMVKKTAGFHVESCYGFHIFSAKFKIENVEVFLNSFFFN